MLTAMQAKFDAEVKRRLDEIWYVLEQEIEKAVCLGKNFLVFSHEGLWDKKSKKDLIKKLTDSPYEYNIHPDDADGFVISWRE